MSPEFIADVQQHYYLCVVNEQILATGMIDLIQGKLNAALFYRKYGFIGDTVSQYQSPRGFQLDCIPMTKCLS